MIACKLARKVPRLASANQIPLVDQIFHDFFQSLAKLGGPSPIVRDTKTKKSGLWISDLDKYVDVGGEISCHEVLRQLPLSLPLSVRLSGSRWCLGRLRRVHFRDVFFGIQLEIQAFM